MTAHPRLRGIACAVIILVLATLPFSAQVGAAPPSTDPAVGAQAAAHWVAGKVNSEGFVPGPTATPNIGSTLQVGVTLADVGTEQATFDRIVTWLAANTETVVTGGGSSDSAGNIGWLLMIVHAAGRDPNAFGGLDLPARLDATLGQFAPGLYGADDPTFDGAFRQGLAIVGLAVNGITPPAAATTWLADQQCGSATPAAAGGWMPYRADTTVACVAPDPFTFEGPDTNSSAMALQAMRSVGAFAGTGPALDFLAAAESPTAGFAFIPGGDDDPNSTALVIQAIVAGGEDPSTGRWVKGSATPFTSLLAWQIGCGLPDAGALASPFSGGSSDAFATIQGIWGLQGAPFPVAGPVTFHAAADPCAPATTTTTTTSPSTPTTVAPTAAAAAVHASPAFTG